MTNKLDLDDVLFHGLSSMVSYERRKKLELARLVNIIRAGNILPRDGVKKMYGERFYNKKENLTSPNWNGEDKVSVCQKNTFNRGYAKSEAFRSFVEGRTCLILNKRVLDKKVDAKRVQDGEVQIEGEIPFDKVIGIGVWMFSKHDLVKHKIENWNDSIDECREQLEMMEESCFVGDIRKILKHYNICVPIYSTRTGEQVLDNESVLREFFSPEEDENE